MWRSKFSMIEGVTAARPPPSVQRAVTEQPFRPRSCIATHRLPHAPRVSDGIGIKQFLEPLLAQLFNESWALTGHQSAAFAYQQLALHPELIGVESRRRLLLAEQPEQQAGLLVTELVSLTAHRATTLRREASLSASVASLGNASSCSNNTPGGLHRAHTSPNNSSTSGSIGCA